MDVSKYIFAKVIKIQYLCYLCNVNFYFMENFNFDEIRPFSDDEVEMAINMIVDDPYFNYFMPFCFPNLSLEEIKQMFKKVRSIDDFQYNIMHDLIIKVVADTCGTLSVEGIEKVSNSSHLFISNHRDIVLDAAILQLVLVDNNLPSSQITIGNNLLGNKFLKNVAKLNKMIISIRGCSLRESWKNSERLSAYIRNSILNTNQSVWIAQRNGRAKDGDDRTEIGLLKMLNISGKNDVKQNFSELNIIPYSVSYQYEPCDFLRARELYLSRRIKYVKKADEDYNSIVTGITQFKGNVHYNFNVNNYDNISTENFTDNQLIRYYSEVLDKGIIMSYKLWNTNYIALDLINNSDKYRDVEYTDDDKKLFIDRMNEGLAKLEDVQEGIDELRDIFLHIYANPVINKINYSQI